MLHHLEENTPKTALLKPHNLLFKSIQRNTSNMDDNDSHAICNNVFQSTLESWYCNRLVKSGIASVTKSAASEGSCRQMFAAIETATL
jgi:hypothetical protein